MKHRHDVLVALTQARIQLKAVVSFLDEEDWEVEDAVEEPGPISAMHGLGDGTQAQVGHMIEDLGEMRDAFDEE